MRNERSRNLRQHDRQAVKTGLRLYTESDSGDVLVIEGRCLDVSLGGLQMSLRALVQPRQRVTVMVDRLRIHASGYIRHCRRNAVGFKAGVEFSGKLRALQRIE